MDRRVRLFLLVGAALVGVAFLWRLRTLLLPFVLAAIWAYLMHPLVNRLEQREVPRAVAIILIYVTVGVVLTLLGYAIIPTLAREVDTILQALPRQTERLEGLGLDIWRDLRSMPIPDILDNARQTLISQVERALERVAARLGDLMLGAVTGMFHLILSPFLAYFLLRDWPSLSKSLLQWFPVRAQSDVRTLFQQINRVLSGFVRGQLIISLIIAAVTAGALALLGVPYAIVVGLIVGAFDVIPYFGPIIGAVPAVVLALTQSPSTVLWVVVLLVAVNQLEGVLLSPKVVGDRVGVHPVTVIFAVLAGAELGGILGMLLAVPVAAILKVTLRFTADRLTDMEGA